MLTEPIEQSDGQTLLKDSVEFKIGGMLAQVGSRLPAGAPKSC